MSLAVHFVAFSGEEYWSAVRVWGRPGFIHRWWDRRAWINIFPPLKQGDFYN